MVNNRDGEERLDSTRLNAQAMRRPRGLSVLRLLLTAAPLALFPVAAHAQQTEAPAADDGEIVVTAQKRDELLQEVPISIAVLGGEELDRTTVQGVSEALTSVPGVLAQESYIGGNTQLAVRGVSASSTLLQGSSPIAYYLDSIPFGLIKTSVAPDANGYDLKRVEVLRGPQGTLYGASALNGVVRVLTNDADLTQFEVKGRGSLSTTEGGGENYRGDAAVNIPIIPGRLAARVAVGYQDMSGWIDRPNKEDANDAEIKNFRAKVKAVPVDELEIDGTVWISRSEMGAPNLALDNGDFPYATSEPQKTRFDLYGLRVGYDFGDVLVSSTTGFLNYRNDGVLELTPLGLAGLAFDNILESSVFSQELLITSEKSGSLRWSVGGMYRNERDRTYQEIPIILPIVYVADTSKSYAVFGELTGIFMDGKMELTGGLRYFHDKSTVKEIVPFSFDPNDPLVGRSSEIDAITPRFALTWLPSDDLTLYASYSQGFRSGLQQQPNVIRTAPEIPPLEPDRLSNFEVGTKGELFDGKLRFDAALYYIRWTDVQTDNAILIAGIPTIGLINGGTVSGIGFDLGLSARPAPGLDISVGFSTNDLTWDDPVISGGGDVIFEAGDRRNLSPKYTASGAIDYEFDLGGDYQARLGASASYTSATKIVIVTGSGQGDDLLNVRASAAIEAPGGWDVTLYVDNLTNEDGRVQQAPFNLEEWSGRLRPRTFGVQLDFSF